MHVVAASFPSHYLNGPLPYSDAYNRKINVLSALLNKTLPLLISLEHLAFGIVYYKPSLRKMTLFSGSNSRFTFSISEPYVRCHIMANTMC